MYYRTAYQTAAHGVRVGGARILVVEKRLVARTQLRRPVGERRHHLPLARARGLLLSLGRSRARVLNKTRVRALALFRIRSAPTAHTPAEEGVASRKAGGIARGGGAAVPGPAAPLALCPLQAGGPCRP